MHKVKIQTANEIVLSNCRMSNITKMANYIQSQE